MSSIRSRILCLSTTAALIAVYVPVPGAAQIGPAEVRACVNPRAIDGDTIRCGRNRVRLLGIDAPELSGHCQPSRHCAPGSPYVAKTSLARGLAIGRVTIEPVAIDHYGRTIAVVRAGGRNLSCWQLAREAAIYVRRWDNGRRIARECRP